MCNNHNLIMKKQIIVMLLSCMSIAAMAQGEAKKLLSAPALQEIAVLKDMAAEITKAEMSAASTSRANAAAAQEKITALYASYAKELQNQKNIHVKDAVIVAAVDAELQLINAKK